ncbi:MAG: GNAT family N-acetyltransferase [Acidobacteria bacterium]|nr:GNAT family N-acetyltransferase [Acidobacteriota bacterium]
MIEFEIRECASHEAFDQCIGLQQKVWAYADIDVMPRHAYVITRNSGGFALGAFLPAGSMIGFVHTWFARRQGSICFYSHMLAVDPEYQSHGVGRSLKLAQRAEAQRRGAERIVWTFDPLQARNAEFNFNRLGVTCQAYEVDYYGTASSSPLHRGLESDRLFVDWWLNSPRVEAIAANETPPEPEPVEVVRIPADIARIKAHDLEEARSIQRSVRARFRECLDRNLYAGGFRRAAGEHACAYLFFQRPR